MLIGGLQEHCGNCSLIDYCTEPYELPQLCTIEELENITVETYIQIAKNIKYEEIKEKIRQNKENEIFSWDDEYRGAICDLVIERLSENGVC